MKNLVLTFAFMLSGALFLGTAFSSVNTAEAAVVMCDGDKCGKKDCKKECAKKGDKKKCCKKDAKKKGCHGKKDKAKSEKNSNSDTDTDSEK